MKNDPSYVSVDDPEVRRYIGARSKVLAHGFSAERGNLLVVGQHTSGKFFMLRAWRSVFGDPTVQVSVDASNATAEQLFAKLVGSTEE